MENKYSIGLDFGTLSCRAVVVKVSNGEIMGEAITPYPDGVIDEKLPKTNIKLKNDWALQNPNDYLTVLKIVVPEAVKNSKVNVEDIIGLGIDFTSCTIMPVSKEGKVLCQYEKYKSNPHSWIKLWKHHAAQYEADKLNKIAEQRGEIFLKRYGGKISSEWMIPKIMQVLDESPEIYEAADCFMEATDWITMQLTGNNVRNSCTAGYKAIWHKQEGYPSKEFFKSIDNRLENVTQEKLGSNYKTLGSKAGMLLPEMAKQMKLNPNIAVSVGNVDAHVAMPAVKITKPGKLLMIMGTSVCNILLGKEERIVPGMCGVVEDGAIPGYYAYEAGQSAVGDIYQWFVSNCINEEYQLKAKAENKNIHQYLEEKAAKLKPGESGLLALDWWNGNRSILVNTYLTGLFLGMTLLTKPEEMYRALIEATAFGQRMIIETFRENGVPVDELYACGGLAEKNAMLMQIYADVTNMEIKISASKQTSALGAAMFGTVAAGMQKGGYDTIQQAADKMAHLKKETYKPIRENVEIYNELYVEYKKLHDYFGRGENNVMKTLKKLRKNIKK